MCDVNRCGVPFTVDAGDCSSVRGPPLVLTEGVFVTLLSQCAATLRPAYSGSTVGTGRFVRNLKSLALSWAFTLGVIAQQTAVAGQPQNIVLFVPDGLRALIVSNETAPTMSAIRDNGVNFKNPHALFPTFTTPNAAAMATGRILNRRHECTEFVEPIALSGSGAENGFLEAGFVHRGSRR